MNSERWNTLLELFDQATALPEKEREAFIERCDNGLKEELKKLIAAFLESEENGFLGHLGDEIHRPNPIDQDSRLGTQIGQYSLEKLIGRGGMGVVYLAEDNKLQRPVALKFLPHDLIQHQEIRKRFLNEARAAAALNHPNICTIFEINDQLKEPFISMAFVDGRSLKEVLREESLPISEALRYSIQICEGLVAAHKRKIIHRDIKPSNLMINEDGRLIIMDFGLAKLPGTEDLSKSGTTKGTISYMSPEQAKGLDVDARTDIWSLGVVLYEMLTQKKPFTGQYEHAVIYSIISEEPKPVESLRQGVPLELRSIINRTLVKNRDDRINSTEDVLNQLRSVDSTFRLRTEITKTSKNLPSIAVLPFVNMSADPENEYFCEGLSEDLINGLTQLSELRVAARTSSFAFKNQNESVGHIGRRLNVQHLLEGSVRKFGNRVRIVAQLIKVEDGYHLWSERYDRVLEDVFEVQDEIVTRILEELKVKLLGTESKDLIKRPTQNPEAYEKYLRARFHWNRRTHPDLMLAVDFSEQALELDASFAGAYSCLADSLVLSGLYGFQPGVDVYSRAMEAVNKALELDRELAEAFTSLGAARVFCEWDWTGAERLCRQGIALNPNYPTGHSFFAGFVLASQGRLDEAINEITIAQHLDPLSFIIDTAAGVIHWQAKQFEKSFEIATRVIETIPQFWLAHALQGLVYEQWQEYDEAIKAFEKAIERSGSASTLGLGMLGHAYAVSGQTENAEHVLEQLGKNHGYVSPYDKAIIYTGLGDKDNAFTWLEEAVAEKSSWTVLINVDPRFEALKEDARFHEIKAKMNLS